MKTRNILRDMLDSVMYLFLGGGGGGGGGGGTINDVITFLICIIQKPKYLSNKRRYLKKENAILLFTS